MADDHIFKDGNFKTNRQQPVAAVLDEATGLPKIVPADTNGLVGIPSQLLRWNPNTGEWEKWDALPTDYWRSLNLFEIPGDLPVITPSENPNVNPGDPENIWYQGGLITWLTSDTPLYISSTDAGDTQTILVSGANDQLETNDGIATLNGQNQVQLDNDFFRVENSFNIGPGVTTGDIYVAEADSLTDGVPDTASKIQLKIPAGINVVTQGTHTVKKNTVVYLAGIQGSVGKSKNAAITVQGYSPFFDLNFEITPLRVYQGQFSIGDVGGISGFGEGTTIHVTATTEDPATPITIIQRIVEVSVA